MTALLFLALFINKVLFNFIKHHNNYRILPLGQFDTLMSTFLIAFCYIKCFWLIAAGVLILLYKVILSPGIHVTSIYLLIGIVISVIWQEKNKEYFLHSCTMFLNFKLFNQPIILRHPSVENFHHAKKFLLMLCLF